MRDDTFLLNANFGIFDIERMRNFNDLAADEKTFEVVRRFHEIDKEFPAAELDKMELTASSTATIQFKNVRVSRKNSRIRRRDRSVSSAVKAQSCRRAS